MSETATIDKNEKIKAKRYKASKLIAGTRLPDFSALVKENPNYQLVMAEALNYVNYCYDNKEVAGFAEDYATTVLGFSVKHVPDYELTSLGHFSWMIQNGAYYPPLRIKELNEKFKTISEYHKSITKDIPPIKSEMVVKKQTSMLIAELDGYLDDVVFNKLKNIENTPQVLVAKFPKATISKVLAHFKRAFSDTKQSDEEICNLTKEELKLLGYVSEEILESLGSANDNVSSKPRKQRKSKKLNPFKMVSRLKFAQNCPEFRLISLSPEKIIGSKVLWVYNKKTRKIGVYNSDSGFTVKGSTLLGFDENTSISKTLRKPKDFLDKLMVAGKVEQRKLLDTVKSTPAKLNGRLNTETLILKVF